jgi:Mg-chelatase subunit ChlD
MDSQIDKSLMSTKLQGLARWDVKPSIFKNGLVSWIKSVFDKAGVQIAFTGRVCASPGKVELPVFPATLSGLDDVLFKANAYHEFGHHKYTDIEYFIEFGRLNGSKAGFMLNAIEDPWMERQVAKFRKEAAMYFQVGPEILTLRGDIRTGENSPFEAISMYARCYPAVVYGWTEYETYIQVAEGWILKHFGDEDGSVVINTVKQILDEDFLKSESTQENAAIVLRILEALKALEPKPEEPEESENDSDGDDQGEGGESDQSGNSDDNNQSQSGGSSDGDQGESGDQSDAGEGGSSSNKDGDQDDSSEESNDGGQSGTDDGEESENDSDPSSDGSEGDSSDDADGTDDKSISDKVSEMLEDESTDDDGELIDYGKAMEKFAEEIANGEHPQYGDVPDVETGEVSMGDSNGAGNGAGKSSFDDSQMYIPKENQAGYERIDSRVSGQSRVLGMQLKRLLASSALRKTKVSRTGKRLASNKLHRIGMKDCRIFKTSKIESKGTAAVSLLCDLSGSTNGECANAIQESMLLLGGALSSVKSQYEVLGFGGYCSNLLVAFKTFGDTEKTFKGRLGESEKLVGGGTPTARALLKAIPRLHSSKSDRKVMFVLTDGDPDDVNAVETYCKDAKDCGIEVVFILIGNGVRKDWLDNAEISYVHIRDSSELSTVVLGELRTALI